MGVKIGSKLPESVRQNGLDWIEKRLLADPEARHVVVLVVDCGRVSRVFDQGEPIDSPTARIVAAEPIRDEAREAIVLAQVAAERSERIGETELDFEPDPDGSGGADDYEVDEATGELRDRLGDALRATGATVIDFKGEARA